jgi:uncharacterized membrane protein
MSQDAGMRNLFVIGFTNEADAFEMRAPFAKLQSIEMEDAVVVTRDPKLTKDKDDELRAFMEGK